MPLTCNKQPSHNHSTNTAQTYEETSSTIAYDIQLYHECIAGTLLSNAARRKVYNSHNNITLKHNESPSDNIRNTIFGRSVFSHRPTSVEDGSAEPCENHSI